ncbi:hypothetical protein [Flavobacterium wongokense]|uniref:hypothetical protein n=1 Tax=Flavobacterium wongokense TaxID=2910674 RepID=UPI001F27A824|nr:hypothetical protein [Flavobacterium sp. WG47]MCF6133541.1 hypothetical protein [Flavobacterium sp. WG47]
MKRKILISICVLLSISSFAQKTKIDTTYFVYENRKELIDNKDILGLAKEFCVYRSYVTTNIFSESNLFGDNSFKILNDKWYIKNNKKWELFFSSKIFKQKKIVTFVDSGFGLYPIKKIKLKGKDCYKYRVCMNNSINSTNSYVLFNPCTGIISINNGGQVLVRTDRKPKDSFNCH